MEPKDTKKEIGDDRRSGALSRDELIGRVGDLQQTIDLLQRELEQLRVIAKNVSDNIWILDLATLKFSYSTPSSVNILGYEPDEIDSLTLEKIITPSSLAVAMRLLQDELERDGRPEVDPDRVITHLFEQIHRDGSIRWVDIQLRFLRDADGKPAAIMGVSRDVTARKLAEEALRESEERFRLLAEKNPTGIAVHADGRLVYVNEYAVRVFGAKSADQLVGRPALDFVHPDYRAHVIERVQRIVREGAEAAPIEEKFLGADGRIIDVEVTGIPIVYRGKPSIMVLMHDVTEKKAMERELTHARKMDTIGRLAGGIAHDLNNMLTPILGYASMLVHGARPGSEELECLTQIEKAAERAKSLTMRLLAFSRNHPVNLRLLSLGRIVAEFERFLARTIREDVAIETRIAADPLVVSADASQIEQILVNLAVNAEQAMPAGGRITIDVRRERRHGEERVVLFFSDTGCGMDAGTQEHLFEPFFTTRPKGTGLGLATVYGIVRQHGGTIEVSSAPGKGAMFLISFPAAQGEEEPPAAAVEAPPAHAEGMTVLIAEDEKSVLTLAQRILESVGYRVLAAAGPAEAVEISGRHAGPIHLLLTDVIMPGMDGRHLAETLAVARPGIGVLYMSGHHQDILVDREVDAAGRGLIQKPFTAPELIGRVREILGQ